MYLRELRLTEIFGFALLDYISQIPDEVKARRKVDKKQTYMKTETCRLYSRDFWIFLPKIIKIDVYNSELYRFKVGAFFWDTVYI